MSGSQVAEAAPLANDASVLPAEHVLDDAASRAPRGASAARVRTGP